MADYAKKDTDVEKRAVRVDFEDGSNLELTLSELSPEIVTQLALHGLGQKFVDSYSGAKTAVEEGEAPSKMAYAKASVAKVREQLLAGEWSAKREGISRVSQLAMAIGRVLGITVEEAVAKLADMDKDTKKEISSMASVAHALAQIRKEAEAKKEAALAERAKSAKDDLRALMS